MRDAECGEVLGLGDPDRYPGEVGLELHQGGGVKAAVALELSHGYAASPKGVDYVVDLEGDRLQCRAGEVAAPGSESEPGEHRRLRRPTTAR